MLNVFVRVWCLASAALTFFMNLLCHSLNVRFPSVHTPSQCDACLLNRMDPFLTYIIAFSLARRCFLWPCLGMNSAAPVSAMSNFRPCLLAHWILVAAHCLSIEMTWLISLPVPSQQRSSTKNSPCASDADSSTHMLSPYV